MLYSKYDNDEQKLLEQVNNRSYQPIPFDWKMLHNFTANNVKLSDYWRKCPITGKVRTDAELIDCGELIQHSGQAYFHIVHLPFRYPNGTPSIKNSDWANVQNKIEQIIVDRIIAHNSSIANSTNSEEEDLISTLFTGIVFPNLSERITGYLADKKVHFSFCYFDSPIGIYSSKGDIQDDRFANSEITFNECIFRYGLAIGNNAIKKLNLTSCIISERLNFFGSTIEDLWLLQCKFMSEIEIYSTNFDSLLLGFNRFYKHFKTHSINTKFCNIHYCTFHGGANFVNLEGQQTLSCQRNLFKKQAKFSIKKWPKNPIGWNNMLDQTIFEDNCDFRGSGFGHFGAYSGVEFKDRLEIDQIASEKSCTEAIYEDISRLKQQSHKLEASSNQTFE